MVEMKQTVYTIGHSTRTIHEFVNILRAYSILIVVDVRTIPRSRHNPQFNREELADSLKRTDIDYLHMAGLGGLRHTLKESPNTGWKNPSFRGYADYMQTTEFWKYLDGLIEISREKSTVIMCAEAVPWRCHRSLIGDALLVKGIAVLDIFDEKTGRPHKMTPFAVGKDGRITYPPPPGNDQDTRNNINSK
jgi:uncharacterized protein (DUF488 family)